jgi:hypothetical protein
MTMYWKIALITHFASMAYVIVMLLRLHSFAEWRKDFEKQQTTEGL